MQEGLLEHIIMSYYIYFAKIKCQSSKERGGKMKNQKITGSGFPKNILKIVYDVLYSPFQRVQQEARVQSISQRGNQSHSFQWKGLASLCLSLALIAFLPSCAAVPEEEVPDIQTVVGVDGTTQVIARRQSFGKYY